MEFFTNTSNLALYMLKEVQIQFRDSKIKKGIFINYDTVSGMVQLEDESFSIELVSDIEYIAKVDDFHTYKGFGEIGNIKFTVDDLHPDFILSDLLYGEFVCTVACHLWLKDMEICAKDIRLVEKYHKLNFDCARAENFLYRYNDGTIVIGSVLGDESECRLANPNGDIIPLELNRIVDITKAPEVNDYIYVTLTTDSLEHSGLVSAIRDTLIILINADGKPDNIDLTKVASIRYRGTVYINRPIVNGKATKKVMVASGSSNGNNDYLCKLPYSRDPEAIQRVKEGDMVSFVAGINDRYRIAKDVEILQSEPVPKKDTVSEQEYYGVIVALDFSKENGYGFVGNRFVTKACGKSVPGNARFTRNQLDFIIEDHKAFINNQVFIVKYTAYEDPQSNLRVVNKISLHKAMDITKLGIVEVSDDGKINTIPLYIACISFYENRDIDVYCNNGQVVSGRLHSHNNDELFVARGNEGVDAATTVPFSMISDIRIIGTISQYYQNGTGYVDNAFFFHINEMEQMSDAQFIRRGTQVSFCLRNTRKGNYVDCESIRVIPSKKVDVYVIDYRDQSYTVVDADKYGKDIHFAEFAYKIPYSFYNQFRDLNNADYHALLTIQRKNGQDECTSIRTFNGYPKLRYGIVTALDRKNNTVSISSVKDYRKKSNSTVYRLFNQGQDSRINNIEKKDYQVLYYTQNQGTIIVATITWVELKDIFEKCFYGYLEQYSKDKEYGWITPEEYIDIQWNKRPKNFGVYCRPSSFVEQPQFDEFNNSKHMWRVCYTLDFDRGITVYSPKPPAKQVWFLERIDRPQKPLPPAPAPEPAPVTYADIVLEEEYPCVSSDKSQWKFGIVSAYSPKFDSIRIYRNFRNKKFADTPSDFEPELITVIDLSVKTVNIDYGEFEKINTANSLYLVRFALIDIDGQEFFDESQPIVFLKGYRKNTIKALEINQGILKIEGRTLAPEPKSVPVPPIAMDYTKGETVIICTGNQEYIVGEFAAFERNTIRFIGGESFSVTEQSVFRIGVLTSFDETMTIGVINGMFQFSFANMEPKTFNIVRTAKRRILLCYKCNDGQINYVERISPELRTKLLVQWQIGKVTDYIAYNEERSIIVNDTIKCYLSVDTGGYIQSLVKSGNIKETVVFVKSVNCPICENGKIRLGSYAFDIHCEQEKSIIRYDAVTDHFLATRSAARSETVEGNYRYLLSLVDKEADVNYRVTDDGYNLQAYISNPDDIEEWADEILEEEDIAGSKALFNTSLVHFFIDRTDLRVMRIPDGITLTEKGWPINEEQVATLAAYFLNKRVFEIKESMAAVALLERLPDDAQEKAIANTGAKSIEAILWRSLVRQISIIGRDVNCVWGEYSYYENTILSDIHRLERLKEELYKYFAQDFYSRIEVMDLLRKFKGKDRRKVKVDLVNMFRRSLVDDSAQQLVAHILPLDEATIQFLFITERVLDDNETITNLIAEWGRRIDNTQTFDSIAALLDHLRLLYRNDKSRFIRELEKACKQSDKITSIENVLRFMKGRFVKMITVDDSNRFSVLQVVCRKIVDNRHAGFIKYRTTLLESWVKINELIKETEMHPTKETTEMLINTQVLSSIRDEIESSLNELLSEREYMPVIRCESNGAEVVEGQKSLMLLVSNGEIGHTNRKSAFNIKLILEVLSGLSSDSIPEEIAISEKELLAGQPDLIVDNIPISLNSLDGATFSIAVTAEYECVIGFNNGEIKKKCTTDCGILEFQLQKKDAILKNKNAINYYLRPSEGNPLKENIASDNDMFFGRKDEIAKIWGAIVDERQRLREGRAVMLYGQKKTGKTSLANQILGRIVNTPEVNEQAIIIKVDDILEVNGGITGLEHFSQNFYQYILMSFEIELMLHHEDLLSMLAENNLGIPDLANNSMAASLFQGFFMRFAALDRGKHRVVLVMDEFTRLCTTLIDYPEYYQIPNFIKLFSSMGFIQIIIGHPNMMKALSTLGIINHTAEFSVRVELTGLKHNDAVALIREPMIRSFGYDVYDTPLGKRSIDMLLDLSGCHPSVLMKLCNEMFIYFINTEYPRIIHKDVDKMLIKYLDKLDPATTFDIMVTEDGDISSFFDSLPTYRYLKYVALQSLDYNNQDCDMDIICPDMTKEQCYNIRDTLLMRKVLVAGNGRIRIVTKLFLEYVRYKYKKY